MANTHYVTANRLAAEAGQHDRKAWTVLRYAGIAIIFVGLAVNPFAAILLGAIAGALYCLSYLYTFMSPSNHILRAGAEGEDQALTILRTLPDTFTLFNQVDLPNPQSRTGVNEADFIVVGPTAIFLIEVKHNNGTIYGSDEDRDWLVEKVGRAGGEYSKTMRNPIGQTKKLVWLLGEHLKAKGAKPWIQGVVLFTHPTVLLELSDTPAVPVLTSSEITDYLRSFRGSARPDMMDKALDHIARLKELSL